MDHKDEQYKWLVRQLMNWYEHLNLSFEQGEKLYQYENTKFEFTTVWDEIERDRIFMESILDERQLQLYLPDVTRRIKSNEEMIMVNEVETGKQLGFLQEQLELMLSDYLPAMQVFRRSFDRILSVADRSEVEEMKIAYQQAVMENYAKVEIEIEEHFRHFGINARKEAELRKEIRKWLPEADIFASHKKYQPLLEKLERLISKYADELDNYLGQTLDTEQSYWREHHRLLNKHFQLDESRGSWRIEIQKDEDESDFERRFSFMLLYIP